MATEKRMEKRVKIIPGSATTKQRPTTPTNEPTVPTRVDAGINIGSRGSKNVNPLYKAASSVTNYVGNVAREVRDIPTAIGTARESMFPGADSSVKKLARENLKQQIKEVGSAATKGKKGTRSGEFGIEWNYYPAKRSK